MEQALVGVVLLAALTDWLRRKIYNWLTLPAIGAGLVLNALQGRLVASLIGFALCFAIFFLLFALGGMKGGDAKLMAAVGAFLGWPGALVALLYTFVAGGILALIWALAHGKLVALAKRMTYALKALMTPGMAMPDIHDSVVPRMPYGLAIAAGTLMTLYGPTLKGLSP